MNIAKLYIVNIAYFQEHLHTTTSEVSLGSDCLGLSFWTVTFKHPDLVISQKYQSLSNQSFKHNSTHIPSLNLTLTLSCRPRFCMFIINGYDSPWTSCLCLLLHFRSIVYPAFFSGILRPLHASSLPKSSPSSLTRLSRNTIAKYDLFLLFCDATEILF